MVIVLAYTKIITNMFKNYFKTAWRTLWKNKTFSFINIFGLAVGIACALLIIFHVKQEVSYDKGFSKADHIYRATLHISGETNRKWAATAPIFGRELKNYFPGIQQVVRFYKPYPYQLLSSTINGNVKRFEERGGLFADTGAVTMFDLSFIHGNPATALSTPDALVLTEATAIKYFGSTDVVGKTIREDARNFPLTVSGVIKNFSQPTHLQFDYLVSMATITRYTDKESLEKAGWSAFYTYLLINNAATEKQIEDRLPDFTTKYYLRAGETREDLAASPRKTVLQPITSIHLHSALEKEITANSDVTYVYIFSIAALFILLIAAVNFINISTAQAFNRMKEIGMRKIVGATRRQLITQFLGESFLVTCIAAMLAVIVFQTVLPFYRQLTGSNIGSSQLFSPLNLVLFLAVVVGISLLAGIYPAWFVAKFNSIPSLKQKKVAGTSVHFVRKGLTVFQFGISVFMMFGTIVIYRQLQLFHDKDLGFDKDQVMAVTMYRDMWNNYGALVNDIDKNPAVAGHATISTLPGERFSINTLQPVTGFGNNKELNIRALWSDDNLLATMHIQLKEGRNFTSQLPQIKHHEYMLNEAAVKALNINTSPIGKKVALEGDTGTVVAVVKDFNFASLHATIDPLVIQYQPYNANYLLLKVKAGQVPQTVKALEADIKKLSPASKLTYTFLDDKLNTLYNTENRMSAIFKTFAAFAIFISCLGLFGLSAYTTKIRTKEIGIRKVLGASVPSLAALLSKEFVTLVLVAIVIAWPISWFAMSRWLQNFAYHTNINVFVFAASGIAAVAVALATVSVQAIKTAVINPVKSLKTE